MTKEELLNEYLLDEIFTETDDIVLEKNLIQLEARARELKCLKSYNALVKAYRKNRQEALKEMQREEKVGKPELLNYTNFPPPYPELACDNWIANENGIRQYTFTGERIASYFPITPILYMQNVHTHAEKVTLAYYKQSQWHTITVPKSVISNSTKIVELSDNGLPVTSGYAKALVEYLALVEARNIDVIPHKNSTTKMGWHGKDFVPFTSNFIYDGDSSFSSLYESLSERGTYEIWLDTVKAVRAKHRVEVLFFLAASFGSPLLEILGVQSFAVNLWGDSEGGKTVCTRLAASVWADSREGRYYGSFLATEAALEAIQGFLNNLPCLIDDSSNVKDKAHFNFSTFVYNRCNEKGKSRSNVRRGVDYENTWRQIVLMTGEQPVITETMQGGAINRTLELNCGQTAIFDDPKKLCDTIEVNYGFAGKDFIEKIQAYDRDYIRKIFDEQLERVLKYDRMKKQSNALAAILTADKLIEELIFKDGVTIDLDEVISVLCEKSFVSENERCYNFLLEQIAVYNDKFKPTMRDENEQLVYRNECWGCYNETNDIVIIIKSIFDRMCKNGGYSSKKFLDWAAKNDKIIKGTDGRNAKLKRLPNGEVVRCVFLRLNLEEDADSSERDTIIDDMYSQGIPF